MGAHTSAVTLTAATRDAAIRAAEAYQTQAQYEHGHGPYTGHLGTAGVGVSEVLTQEFDSEEEAQIYIFERHDKWELPMLARVKGTDKWVLAGWCSS